jgi:hypothetical protein
LIGCCSLYFVFLDGDLELVESHDYGRNTGDPYRTFEAYLLEWEPAVGFPGSSAPPSAGAALREVDVAYNFDAILTAFHRDAADFLLPYDTHWERSASPSHARRFCASRRQSFSSRFCNVTRRRFCTYNFSRIHSRRTCPWLDMPISNRWEIE